MYNLMETIQSFFENLTSVELLIGVIGSYLFIEVISDYTNKTGSFNLIDEYTVNGLFNFYYELPFAVNSMSHSNRLIFYDLIIEKALRRRLVNDDRY